MYQATCTPTTLQAGCGGGGAIVFASIREAVQTILTAMEAHKPLVRARGFYGQGAGAGVGGGMT